MLNSGTANKHAKVFYTPVEAAIRWCGLAHHERRIIRTLRGRNRFHAGQFRRWPALHLNTERIFDGLVNGDLPFGRGGVTYNDPALLSHPDLTVRHVDLRAWMRHHYPDQKPDFLFDPLERLLHPSISIDMLQTLIVERELLRATCTSYKHSLEELQRAHDTLRREHARLSAQRPDSELSSRAEIAYLNIIGAMLKLMLGQSPSGKPYSQFRSQEAIISALTAHHGTLMGIAERTLQVKFAQANRRLAQAA